MDMFLLGVLRTSCSGGLQNVYQGGAVGQNTTVHVKRGLFSSKIVGDGDGCLLIGMDWKEI